MRLSVRWRSTPCASWTASRARTTRSSRPVRRFMRFRGVVGDNAREERSQAQRSAASWRWRQYSQRLPARWRTYWNGLHGGRHHQGRRASHCLTRASRAEETMARPKRWYDPEASQALRVVTRSENELSYAALRWRHPRVMPGIGECLLYPLSDGPGLRLLVLFPPAFWVLSLPIFDFIAFLQPLTKSDWALGLAILPIFLPLMFSFAMTLGYVLLFLGYVLVASAMGENDHPRWPEWHPAEISEGIIR